MLHPEVRCACENVKHCKSVKSDVFIVKWGYYSWLQSAEAVTQWSLLYILKVCVVYREDSKFILCSTAVSVSLPLKLDNVLGSASAKSDEAASDRHEADDDATQWHLQTPGSHVETSVQGTAGFKGASRVCDWLLKCLVCQFFKCQKLFCFPAMRQVSLPRINTSGEYLPLKFSLEHYTCSSNETGKSDHRWVISPFRLPVSLYLFLSLPFPTISQTNKHYSVSVINHWCD